MERKSFYLTMTDGHEVFVRCFHPAIPVIGHVHILHGMAEHSERYEYFASTLCEQGYVVSAHDHRGHGYTAAKNGQLGFFGYSEGFEQVVQDVYEVLEQVASEVTFTGRPILFGHSMGSFIARRFAQRYSERIDKLILSGTASPTPLHKAGNILAKQLVKWQGATTVSPLMNRLSFGNFNQNIKNAKTEYDWLSTDEAEVQKYIADPYCGFIATTQFYADLTGGILSLNDQTKNAHIRPNLPILLVSGTADSVGESNAKGVVKAGEQLVAAGVKQVKVHLFEGMRHEILNEKQKHQVIEIIVRWLKDEKEN